MTILLCWLQPLAYCLSTFLENVIFTVTPCIPTPGCSAMLISHKPWYVKSVLAYCWLSVVDCLPTITQHCFKSSVCCDIYQWHVILKHVIYMWLFTRSRSEHTYFQIILKYKKISHSQQTQNICITFVSHPILRRLPNIVQMLYICFVLAGLSIIVIWKGKQYPHKELVTFCNTFRCPIFVWYLIICIRKVCKQYWQWIIYWLTVYVGVLSS